MGTPKWRQCRKRQDQQYNTRRVRMHVLSQVIVSTKIAPDFNISCSEPSARHLTAYDMDPSTSLTLHFIRQPSSVTLSRPALRTRASSKAQSRAAAQESSSSSSSPISQHATGGQRRRERPAMTISTSATKSYNVAIPRKSPPAACSLSLECATAYSTSTESSSPCPSLSSLVSTRSSSSEAQTPPEALLHDTARAFILNGKARSAEAIKRNRDSLSSCSTSSGWRPLKRMRITRLISDDPTAVCPKSPNSLRVPVIPVGPPGFLRSAAMRRRQEPEDPLVFALEDESATPKRPPRPTSYVDMGIVYPAVYNFASMLHDDIRRLPKSPPGSLPP